jgi:hypothetical protein
MHFNGAMRIVVASISGFIIAVGCHADRPGPNASTNDWVEACKKRPNCGQCASEGNCAFCPTTNTCLYYSETDTSAATTCPGLIKTQEKCGGSDADGS